MKLLQKLPGAKVQSLLPDAAGVQKVSIYLAKSEATIDMDKHILTSQLMGGLKGYPKYQLEEKNITHQMHATLVAEETKSWFAIYKPILIMGPYITGITLLAEYMRRILLGTLDAKLYGIILFSFLFL